MAPRNLPSPIESREQAAEYLGFVASERIKVGDKVFEIPNPSMLDDEQQNRLDALELEAESWDRHDDVLNEDGTVKFRGTVKEPFRKDGVLVENYKIQQARAILGDDFEAFIAAGGRSSDINLIWVKMNRKLSDRAADDSKSAAGDSEVAAVPGEAES
jgi:hypothetical protein